MTDGDWENLAELGRKQQCIRDQVRGVALLTLERAV
jgi:hypothetical protein